MTLKRSKVVTVFILATLCLIFPAFSKSALAVESNRPSPVGEQRTIVILVEFTDLKHTLSRERMRERFFVEMNKYFMEVSYGQTWVTGNVTDWYLLQESSSYYRWVAGDREALTKGAQLITRAVRIGDKDVDFSSYRKLYERMAP